MQTGEREQYVVIQKQRYFPLSRSLELLRYNHISKQGSNIYVSFIIWLRVSGGFQYGGIQIKWSPPSFGLWRGLCGRSWRRFSVSHMSFTAKGTSSYEMWPQILQRMSWRAHWKVRVYHEQLSVLCFNRITSLAESKFN